MPKLSMPRRRRRSNLKITAPDEPRWSNADIRKMAEDLERQTDDRDENASLEAAATPLVREVNYRLRAAAVHLRAAYAEVQAIPLARYGQCARCFESKEACQCMGGPMGHGLLGSRRRNA